MFKKKKKESVEVLKTDTTLQNENQEKGEIKTEENNPKMKKENETTQSTLLTKANEGEGAVVAEETAQKEKKERKPINTKKVVAIAVVVTLVFLAGFTALLQSLQPEPLETVTIAPVEIRDIEETIETSGYIESNYVKTYFSPVSAMITECNVEQGSMVEVGDLLIGYDISDLELAAKQAELTDKAAQSGYENTLQNGTDSESKISDMEDKIDEYEDLVKEKEKDIESINGTLKSYNQELNGINSSVTELTPQQIQRKGVLESGIYSFEQQLQKAQNELAEYNTKLTEYKSEKSGAEAATLSEKMKEQIEAEKELSQLNKDTATKELQTATTGVLSEFTGLVTDVQAVKGSMASEGSPLFTVADLNSVKITVNLSKNNLVSIAEGQVADVTINGTEYIGSVAKINRQAVVSQTGSPVVTAEITVDELDDNVYLGIEAGVVIHTVSAVEVVSIPAKALNTGKDGYFCYAVVDGFVEKRNVTIGANDGEYIEIVDGLEEGEDVITVVTATIKDGVEVYTMYEDEAYQYEGEDEYIDEDEEHAEDEEETEDEESEDEEYMEDEEFEDEEYTEDEESEDEEYIEDEESEDEEYTEDEEFEDEEYIEDEESEDEEHTHEEEDIEHEPSDGIEMIDEYEEREDMNLEESEEGEYEL